MNIRKDDIVEVVTGDDAGTPKARTTARVLRVMPTKRIRSSSKVSTASIAI